jgi:hypothetical protein
MLKFMGKSLCMPANVAADDPMEVTMRLQSAFMKKLTTVFIISTLMSSIVRRIIFYRSRNLETNSWKITHLVACSGTGETISEPKVSERANQISSFME